MSRQHVRVPTARNQLYPCTSEERFINTGPSQDLVWFILRLSPLSTFSIKTATAYNCVQSDVSFYNSLTERVIDADEHFYCYQTVCSSSGQPEFFFFHSTGIIILAPSPLSPQSLLGNGFTSFDISTLDRKKLPSHSTSEGLELR